jgi:RNA-directed DNA polymerase
MEEGSYGFRRGRNCHDAIKQIKQEMQTGDKYILDADIKSCFDEIDHEALISKMDKKSPLARAARERPKTPIQDQGKQVRNT